MEEISSFFTYIMNSEEIIQTGGLLAILLIVYIENGLFFGFFLPGDYLLFLTGVFVSSQHLDQPLLLVLKSTETAHSLLRVSCLLYGPLPLSWPGWYG